MNQAMAAGPTRRRFQPQSDHRTETVYDDETIQELLDPLDDEDCLHILDAIDENALSASEIAAACDLPLSSTYRKIEQLVDAGVVSQGVRLSENGNHTAEYERLVDDVMVSVSATGFEVRIVRRDSDRR